MTSTIQSFRPPAEIVTGRGALGELGRIASGLGRRCVVVTGRKAARVSGALGRAVACLEAAGVTATVFEGVEEDPSAATVDRVRSLVREARAELVVGIGGGSAMDAAKAAGGLAGETEATAIFLREQRDSRGGLPVIAVATTSGTGAEVTPNAVISEPAARLKASIRGAGILPAAAIVDPLITVSCPRNVTADSGMDAVTQSVEAFVSIHATALTDALAFKAFRLLMACLPRALDDGADIEAREGCAYGSLMAGLALAAARLGAVHGMAHPLGARYGIPHGLICAMLLPEVVRINMPYAPGKYARLAAAAGGDLLEALKSLNELSGISARFAVYSVPKEDFQAIVEESLPSGSLKANPKRFCPEDIVSVLRSLSA